MNNLRILLYLFLVLLLSACLDGGYTATMSSSFDDYVYDCEIGMDYNEDYFNEEELAIADACKLNRFETKEEIEKNIIGEFELIHTASNWYDLPQPCLYLWFEETSTVVVHFSNPEIDTIYRTNYEVNNNNRVKLENAIYVSFPDFISLCDNYLTTTTTCDDCYLMIFERKK